MSLEDNIQEELERIQKIWNRFSNGELKTVGVENLFVVWLGLNQEIDKIHRYIALKQTFPYLNEYAQLFDKSHISTVNKKRIGRLVKYGNESRGIRFYSFLKTIESLGGDKTNTWITRSQLQIINHISSKSVDDGCEFLYTMYWLQRKQDSKAAPTKGSISYNLTKKGRSSIEEVDKTRRKIDQDVWDDYICFLSNRCVALQEQGACEKLEIESYIVGSGDEALRETVLYAGVKIEPTREIIGKIGERIFKAVPVKK